MITCRCPICNKPYMMITHSHVTNKHQMTLTEFVDKYPSYYQYSELAENDRIFSYNAKNLERKKLYAERSKKSG